jgi:hypothetical protein
VSLKWGWGNNDVLPSVPLEVRCALRMRARVRAVATPS